MMGSSDELRHVGSPTSEPHHTDAPADGTAGAHGLGPHVLGVRIVVRHLVPERRGPSGGPAVTDVLGVVEEWEPDLVVRREDGTRVTIARRLIVSGKPVPPRSNPVLRVDAATAQRRIRAMWPGERAEIGAWLLQASPAYAGRLRVRANSALAYGDPGRGLPEALDAVRDFYMDRERAPRLCVPADSAVEQDLAALGCVPDPDTGATALWMASVSRVRRTLRGGVAPAGDLDGELLVSEEGTVLRARWEGPATRGAAEIEGDWICLHDLWVDPQRRRTGLGTAVIAELLDLGAERGAMTAALHTLVANPATALYAGLGFAEHHVAHYLRAPR